MTKLSSVRILHLTTSFPLTASSISGIFIYRLICHFPSEIQTVVLTPDSRVPVKAPSGTYRLQTFHYALKRWQTLAHEPGGLPAAFQCSRWNLLFLPSFFFSMLLHTIIQSCKSDVIHAHWTINGVIAGIAGLLTRTPVITTLRGEDVNRGQSTFLHRCLLFLCLRLSNCIVTVSSSMQKEVLARFPESEGKISFIPNGVSDSLFILPLLRKTIKPIILVLGSLIPVKGVDLIITALSTGCKMKQWELVIAGIGSEQEKLQAMVHQEGIEGKVKFIGQIPPTKVADLLTETDILVQASYREGRPNAVIEAMAAGVSVIGTDIDGINELIEHGKNGLLFSAGNAEELSVQLQVVLDSFHLRKKFGQAGRQTLLDQNLTWPKCAAAYMAVYQLIAKEKSR